MTPGWTRSRVEMDPNLANRTYRLAEVCYAIGIAPDVFRNLMKRGILAPVHKPVKGAPRGYRLAEIWSAALILELAKFGLAQMEAAKAVAGLDVRNPVWWMRDENAPFLLAITRRDDGSIAPGRNCRNVAAVAAYLGELTVPIAGAVV